MPLIIELLHFIPANQVGTTWIRGGVISLYSAEMLNSLNSYNVIGGLLRIAPHVKIAAHIPGRIRLRISVSGVKTVQKVDMEITAGSIPGIRNMRINPFARSAIIEYDREQLPYDLWESLGQVRNRPELAPEVGEKLHSLFKRWMGG